MSTEESCCELLIVEVACATAVAISAPPALGAVRSPSKNQKAANSWLLQKVLSFMETWYKFHYHGLEIGTICIHFFDLFTCVHFPPHSHGGDGEKRGGQINLIATSRLGREEDGSKEEAWTGLH